MSTAFDAVEGVHSLLPPVELKEIWVLLKPAVECSALKVIQSPAIDEQELAHGIAPHVARNELSSSVKMRSEKAQYVELIGDKLGTREKAFSKALIGIGEIEHHVFHVLSAWDVRERHL